VAADGGAGHQREPERVVDQAAAGEQDERRDAQHQERHDLRGHRLGDGHTEAQDQDVEDERERPAAEEAGEHLDQEVEREPDPLAKPAWLARDDAEVARQEQDGHQRHQQQPDHRVERARIRAHQRARADQGSGEARGGEDRHVAPHDLPGPPIPVAGSGGSAEPREAVGRDRHLRREPQEDQERDRHQASAAHHRADGARGDAHQEDEKCGGSVEHAP
jgi:hypothetical protein